MIYYIMDPGTSTLPFLQQKYPKAWSKTMDWDCVSFMTLMLVILSLDIFP